MLEHLRERVLQAIQGSSGATLSTCGPLGLQVGHFPCAYHAEKFYLLVPATLDLLENLAAPAEVMVTDPRWQVWGAARVIDRAPDLPELACFNSPSARWSVVVEVRPFRIQFSPQPGSGAGDTIDFD